MVIALSKGGDSRNIFQRERNQLEHFPSFEMDYNLYILYFIFYMLTTWGWQ